MPAKKTTPRKIDPTELQVFLEQLVTKSRTPIPTKVRAIEQLNEQYRSGNLTLVLGAGVSMAYGLLSWNSLLQKLLISTFEEELSQDVGASSVLASLFNKVFQPTPLIAGRYLNNFYGTGRHIADPLAMISEVRNNLYIGLKADTGNGIMKQIRRLCLAVGRSPNLKGIVTYNFDDLVEKDLEASDSGIRFRSIYSPGVHPEDDELGIFHVHGFLPREGNLAAENKIVFSENFYHEQYNNFYDWSNLTQINMFSRTCCLFIGSSLTDPNQRRLLDISKTIRGDDKIHHYCIKKRHSQEDVSKRLDRVLTEFPDLLDEKSRASLGREQTIRHLIHVMENYEQKDAESFGVGIIWVKEHKDASDVMKDIKSR